jgi:hypothetical protein
VQPETRKRLSLHAALPPELNKFLEEHV